MCGGFRAIVMIAALLAALAAPLALGAGAGSASAATVTVSVTPSYGQLRTGQMAHLTAQVVGTSNTAVTWQVDNITGGSATVGTISSSGLYTAPATLPNPPYATVTAVSQAQPSASATATITLLTQAATGTTYYVATTGNDSNSGTAAKPWKTIQHAADVAVAGDTVIVEAGIYNELVSFKSNSGNTTAGYITFLGQGAIIDGTGLEIPGGQWGLVTLWDVNYIVINGFELRNYTTTSTADVPIGIYIFDADNSIQLVNNNIYNIITTAATNPSQCGSDALGIAVYGSEAPQPISDLVISGNSLHNLKTGCSESMSLDGNVDDYAVVSNTVYDNDNIGIDSIGFEGVSPDPAYDQARDGDVRGNLVYNITSNDNPDYGSGSYAADGIYVDGGTDIVIEQNLVHNTDIGIEMASEHHDHVTSNVIARNNLVYYSNAVGVTIGGYGTGVGGTNQCTIVNNTLFDNDTAQTGSGEFQIQYYATNNRFENNIAYANEQALLINNYTSSETDPATVNYNLYFSNVGSDNSEWIWEGKGYFGYQNYRNATGNDGSSPPFSNPQFISISNPPDLDLEADSPAIGVGNDSLGASIFGAVDFAGNPRVAADDKINIGAYEQ
jgi:hypothetical protein